MSESEDFTKFQAKKGVKNGNFLANFTLMEGGADEPSQTRTANKT